MDVDWKFWMAMTAASLQALFGYLGFRLQKQQFAKATKKNRISEMTWLQKYWPAVVMLFSMVGSWTPYFLTNKDIPAHVMRGYGVSGTWPGTGWPSIHPQVSVMVNGAAIYSYRETHHVAGVAFHLMSGDPEDVSALQKSALYDIKNETSFEIVIPVDSGFMAEYNSGARLTNYRALLIPNAVRMEDFRTIREAHKLGVIDLGEGSGPP